MASPGVTGPIPTLAADPAARRILLRWLDEFTATLFGGHRDRAAIVSELSDGLHTAAERRLAGGGLTAEEAARAAVAEFGPPRLAAAGFLGEIVAGQARRVAVGLLVCGPVVGAAWLATKGLLWPLRPAPLLTELPLLVTVLAVAVPAAILAVAAGRVGRWMAITGPALAPNAALVAALGCVAGDATLLGALGYAALDGATPTPTVWVAAALSALRLGAAVVGARRCAAGRAALR